MRLNPVDAFVVAIDYNVFGVREALMPVGMASHDRHT
jgi:hypothetical protein